MRLHQEGYVLFRNVLSPSQVREGMSCFRQKQVFYSSLRKFIDDAMMGVLRDRLQWNAPKYVKFRASNNNNSDAGAFHRDVIPHEHRLYPVFTCLTYFDQTTMELIPGTHLRHQGSIAEAISWYQRAQKVTIYPGDVLLFYSTLLHRGIFTEKIPNRRLIQVFEVFSSLADYNAIAPKICHVLGHETTQSSMNQAFQIPIIAWVLNWIGFLNSFTGYGNDYFQGVSFMSSEGFRARLQVDENEWQEGNKYILCDKTHDLPKEHESTFHWRYYHRQYVLHSLLILVLLISLGSIGYSWI